METGSRPLMRRSGWGSDARILAAGRSGRNGIERLGEGAWEIRGKTSFPIQVSRYLIIFVRVSLFLLCE